LLFDFATNVMPNEERSELSGPTFSPDGQTLFFNIYSRSVTVAVWGPWGTNLI
jgi:secreted PhoX family phosphatase